MKNLLLEIYHWNWGLILFVIFTLFILLFPYEKLAEKTEKSEFIRGFNTANRMLKKGSHTPQELLKMERDNTLNDYTSFNTGWKKACREFTGKSEEYYTFKTLKSSWFK